MAVRSDPLPGWGDTAPNVDNRDKFAAISLPPRWDPGNGDRADRGGWWQPANSFQFG